MKNDNAVLYLTVGEPMKATFPRGLRNEVMAWVMANQDELIEEWKKWHP